MKTKTAGELGAEVLLLATQICTSLQTQAKIAEQCVRAIRNMSEEKLERRGTGLLHNF